MTSTESLKNWLATNASHVSPRVALWLVSEGFGVGALNRLTGEWSSYIPQHGLRDWTEMCQEWVGKQFQEWAQELGYSDGFDAFGDGHDDEEFEEWLLERVANRTTPSSWH